MYIHIKIILCLGLFLIMSLTEDKFLICHNLKELESLTRILLALF